jgi:hypothetical protein
VSVGKRRLSDKCDDISSQGNVAKAPRFDSSVVLTQLKGQETLLSEVKDDLGKLDFDVVIGQVLPQPVKDVIVGLGKAVNKLLKSQENLTSVLVDVVKVKENSQPAMAARNPGEVKTKTKPPPPLPLSTQRLLVRKRLGRRLGRLRKRRLYSTSIWVRSLS